MSSLNNEEDCLIVDTRFQSFRKCFIIDILKADLSKFPKYNVVKIHNRDYVQRVSITGLVIAVYENTKFFRCKIDDSTGKINVTIWKEQIFTPINEIEIENAVLNNNNRAFGNDPDEATLNETIFGNDSEECSQEEKSNEIQNLFQSIRNRTNDSKLNNFIQNRPVQGDVVTVRGLIKCYRNVTELNALSTIKLKTSNEEYLEMLMPIVLDEKCYELSHVDKNSLSKLNSVDVESNNKEVSGFDSDDNFLNLVHARLIYLTTTQPPSGSSRKPCSSYTLYNHIRDKYTDYRSITIKDVSLALKHLEMKSLIYSCDDDKTFLPII